MYSAQCIIRFKTACAVWQLADAWACCLSVGRLQWAEAAHDILIEVHEAVHGVAAGGLHNRIPPDPTSCRPEPGERTGTAGRARREPNKEISYLNRMQNISPLTYHATTRSPFHMHPQHSRF